MSTQVPIQEAEQGSLRGLVLAALGVVYGDIGTSPLYALKEAFGEAGGLSLSEPAVLGILSLVFWSLILIVTVKYVALILRADNRGEGGVLALGTLAARAVGDQPRLQLLIFCLSIGGLALFYGDGLITPAISVLSAIEGLNTATPAFAPYVLPLSAAILVGLFLIQSHGTALVGALFGPIMLVWFVTLAVLGLVQIAENPAVLRALDPRYAVGFFEFAGFQAFIALGAVVLAVTGAEALYADMGHFGRTPIRVAWLALVFPGLVLNYFGQGALILRDHEALEHPFYHLAPDVLLYPLIALATAATIIASQAVISGVFSVTRQAIQLNYLPRLTVRHTSATEMGQIYLPQMNWLLMAGVLLLVLAFGSSGALAAAYGIAVTGTMGATAILGGIVAAKRWGWGKPLAALVFGPLFLIDLTYFAANALKIPQGGWFPLAVGAAIVYIVIVWNRGRSVLWNRLYARAFDIGSFIEKLDAKLPRVPGTAVFLTGNSEKVPNALLHNLKHNKVLHERVVIMTVCTEEVPYVPEMQRIKVEMLGKGFFRMFLHYGFMDLPNVLRAFEHCKAPGLGIDLMTTSFFLSHETLIPSPGKDMNPVEERLFIYLAASAMSATAYFCIPPDQVVELGTQIEI